MIGNLTYFLLFVVTTFLLFIFLYARYSRFQSDIGSKQAEVRDLEEKNQRRIEAIKEQIRLKRMEAQSLGQKLDALRRDVGL